MKKIATLMAAVLVTMTAAAQTLSIQTGQVTWLFPANQAGEMTWTDGQTLTVMNKTFSVSDITAMTVDQTQVTDGTVGVSYDGTTANVTVAGNVAQYLTVETSGAHVSIVQSEDLAEEITYTLAGTSADGGFYMEGSYKATIELNGLTLTNQSATYSGAAVHIQNGKRIKVKPLTGTTNTLVDAASGAQKGCLYIKGHAEFAQKGTLNVTGNVKHAIKTGEYFTIKNATINVLGAVGDGISCNEYFLMESGTINISGTQDDGIQCDLDGTESTGELTDHEDEDSGNIYISGGELNISVTADKAKAIKSEGDFNITGGTITCTTSGGGVWDTDDLKTKAAACLSADGNMTVSGEAVLNLTSTGAGGKGISVDGTLTFNGGTTTASTSGNALVASSSGSLSVITDSRNLDYYTTSYKSSPKGIKADGAIIINDGIINVTTTGAGGEGIESKDYINITGGQVIVNASDDAINAAYKKNDQKQWVSGSGDLTITGGYIFARSTGNDGMDSNGDTKISGGIIYAIGASGGEMAIDANTEEQKKLYITGGTIFALGNLENGASITGGTCKQTTSWTGNTWYALYNGSTLVGAFKTPTKSSTSTGGGPGGGGPGGGGPGGGNSQKLVVYTSSTPALKSGATISGGTEYFDGMAKFDCTVSGGSDVTLSNYSSSGGGGGWW
ncbi:MAG: carbohydrate-binding domain-containing protein [Prevotella sp.]|nr:carbohydrate-binding domain-containing protein [Prevotella sp.]